MNRLIIVIYYLVVYGSIFLISVLTPYITRKTESFGVSIPTDKYHDKDILLIRNKYRNSVVLFGGIIAIIALVSIFTIPSKYAIFFITAAMLIQMGVMSIFYLKSHKKMKKLKNEKQWSKDRIETVVIDTEFRNKKVVVSPVWFALYLVVIGITLGFGMLYYDQMPDRIPMQYAMDGTVSRWADKSYRILLFAPLVQTFLTTVMVFVYWVIRKAKQQIDPSNTKESLQQNRVFRYRWSAFIVFGGLLLLGLFTIMQASFIGFIKGYMMTTGIPLAFTFIIIVVAIILSITTGQGGSRIRIHQKGSDKIISRDDDKYWKLGIFYYNPEDPALFVEKRFGVGWTSNFARPMTWVIFLILIVLIVLLTIGTTYLAK